MELIDAHHHLWAPQTPELDVGYVWLKDIGAMKPFGDPTPIQRDYLLPEFLGEPAPRTLAGSVHVQADPKIPDPVAETAFVQKISEDSGHPIMIVGFVDLTADNAAEVMQRHKAHKNLRGIRQIISHLPDRPEISFAATNLLDDPAWRANFAGLKDYGLRFDLQLYPEQMLQAAEFLSDHPDIPVVIDHMGSPYDPRDLSVWARGMGTLAALPHVSVKLSGYAMFFGPHLDGPAQRVTQEILTGFGPDRVMFGSNFPVDSLHLSYPALLAFVEGEVGEDAEARMAVMGGTARAFYQF
ncbi:amidohydrolase [uncultured Sulfitobacter sp.]|uniref:amidohydrolase family protein n=1 Tax=uncultured Sulfitobacter sp. TaxID=191468 RepID=UPI00262DBD16|nr:amidohydrolase family protein [uncultured Sulfitobacter sp.]